MALTVSRATPWRSANSGCEGSFSPAANRPSSGEWRDPSNVRRIWREVQAEVVKEGFVSHTLRKTVATFLDDADVSPRKISDQLGHSKVSMTQDRYLGRKLTDRHTADVLDNLLVSDTIDDQ